MCRSFQYLSFLDFLLFLVLQILKAINLNLSSSFLQKLIKKLKTSFAMKIVVLEAKIFKDLPLHFSSYLYLTV
jgi:hypothetical protein